MTAVVDASVLVELLTQSPRGRRAAALVQESSGDLHIPHLADVEVLSVVRGLVSGGVVTDERGSRILDDLRDFPAQRWPAHPLFGRMWQLRQNVTAYDATYVALAEALDARLLTADKKLVRGVRGVATCDIVTID